MDNTLTTLIERLRTTPLSKNRVIPWGCPIASFGNPTRSRVATLGLNPSNREFVDESGRELDGDRRRFHTLHSLGLSDWHKADPKDLELIVDCCHSYFARNPYDGWFKKLDHLISGI